MNVPSGYSEIGMIGYTDRGDYASNVTYVKNDLVHYSGGLWRCLIDDTTGVEPREGVNWTIFVQLPESAAESLIAPIESDAGASERAYAIGERLILNDTLYKAKTAISVGDELVVNTNIELAGNVSTQLDGKADKTNAFLIDAATENTLADNDTVPFYDTSASSKRKTTWSNIVAKIKASLSKSDVGLGNVPNVSTNDQTPTFTQASSRANIASGEKLSTIFGKIMKVIADLKAVAFTGAYSDLSGKPTKLSQFDNDSQYLKFIGFFPNGTSMLNQPDGIYQITPSSVPTELVNAESTYGVNPYGQLFNQKQGYTHIRYTDVFGNTLTWRSYDSNWVVAYTTGHQPSWNDIQSKPSAFTPTSHASSDTGYGVGNASNYGHVKLSDDYQNNLGAAANGLGASQNAVYNLYNIIKNQYLFVEYTRLIDISVPAHGYTELTTQSPSSYNGYKWLSAQIDSAEGSNFTNLMYSMVPFSGHFRCMIYNPSDSDVNLSYAQWRIVWLKTNI